NDGRGRDGGVRQELATGAVLRSGSSLSGAKQTCPRGSEALRSDANEPTRRASNRYSITRRRARCPNTDTVDVDLGRSSVINHPNQDLAKNIGVCPPSPPTPSSRRGHSFDRNIWPDFRVFRVQCQPFLKPWFGISLDGIDGTFRFANATVDAFVRMDHEHILAL